MKFRKNHKKRVLGDTAMRAKPWDATSKHAANMEAIGKAVGSDRSNLRAIVPNVKPYDSMSVRHEGDEYSAFNNQQYHIGSANDYTEGGATGSKYQKVAGKTVPFSMTPWNRKKQ